MRCEHCQAKLGKHSGANHRCWGTEKALTHSMLQEAAEEPRRESAPKPRRRRRKSETPD